MSLPTHFGEHCPSVPVFSKHSLVKQPGLPHGQQKNHYPVTDCESALQMAFGSVVVVVTLAVKSTV